MAVTKQQTIGMMHKKFSELQNRLQNKKDIVNYSERLYEIRIDFEYITTLNVKYFEHADKE